jgi:hypothetical protein
MQSEKEYRIDICDDCLSWLANGDESGASEDWQKENIHLMWPGYEFHVGGGTDQGFSHLPCETCDGLAGNRTEITAVLLKTEREREDGY